ncbi:epidermal growth factor-like protein 7 [Pelodytes ibericus]
MSASIVKVAIMKLFYNFQTILRDLYKSKCLMHSYFGLMKTSSRLKRYHVCSAGVTQVRGEQGDREEGIMLNFSVKTMRQLALRSKGEPTPDPKASSTWTAQSWKFKRYPTFSTGFPPSPSWYFTGKLLKGWLEANVKSIEGIPRKSLLFEQAGERVRETPVEFSFSENISLGGFWVSKRMWWSISCLLASCFLVLRVSTTGHFYQPGRRICSSQSGTELVTQSFIQPIYKPVVAMCPGHRICSTYRTTYKISYRQVSKTTFLPLYSCCPGWSQSQTHGHSCYKASCQLPCQNGGSCAGFNQCRCVAGWTGNHCQTDVDECKGGRQRCTQLCINTAGSFHCQCLYGFSLSEDGRTCLKVEKPTEPTQVLLPTGYVTSVPDNMKEEMEALRNKIEVLEQKLQLVLAPFNSLSTYSAEYGADPIGFLTHSFQQLDRIDSLSEQISFLEERLETCSCKTEL